MKTSIATLALVAATATSAFAAETTADVNWVGSVTDLPDVCVFIKNVDGEMSYTENTDNGAGVWTVTKRAELGVNRRGDAVLKIEADDKIVRDDAVFGDMLTASAHTMYDVEVDYASGDYPSVIRSSVYNPGEQGSSLQEFAAGSSAEFLDYMWGKHNTIKLGGTATVTNPNAYIDNGKYTLGHTATCIQ